jgi:SNF2 family DNA or RNA helicase
LGQYVDDRKTGFLSRKEKETLQNLSRAGKRLMGFCRTGLFKRLESSGEVFLQSLQRHILRNYVFLHALENNLPVPIGTQDAALLDSRMNDEDVERSDFFDLPEEDELPEEMIDPQEANPLNGLHGEAAFKERAAGIYQDYSKRLHNRFNWLPASIFSKELKEHLQGDAQHLMGVLAACGAWDWRKDAKLQRLTRLIQETHPDKKIIIFTQFADTVNYLEACLKASGVTKVAGVVGSSADPTEFARRFSPASNDVAGQVRPEQELRVLVATDVLSEGQNLQDGHIVVNYDLPWAIVRLIQRAGRVDRIGQKSDTILCYSFLPAEGVERIIRLRARVRQRLH